MIISNMEIFGIFPSWLLTTILVLFMFYIFLYTLSSTKNSSSPKLPPSPPRLPIIGNLHQILGKFRHVALWELSKKYGPVMQIHIGSKPFLVISSPPMAKQILKTQDHIFCSRPMSRATKLLTYNYLDVAFSPPDNHWREMRKIFVSELLGPKRAKLFKHVLVSETESMVRSVSSHPSNVAINLNELLLATVKGVVCKLAFGENYRQQPISGPSWEEMVDETQTMLGGSVGDSFPWLGRLIDRLSGWNGKLQKCFSNIDAYIETIIDDHHKHSIGELSDDNKDFVHTLIDLCSNQNASSGYQLTKEDMKALIMNVVSGGIDTPVVTLVWAISEIARNTRVMQKLQSEIRDQMQGRQKVEELDTTKMTYLRMVIKETLRMHPAVPLLIPHHSISHCQIGGYDVFPGTSVLINAWGIARDPSVWGENAGEFYPERFENFEGDFEMVPFGGGRRTCPAINTAPVILEFVIANLVCWFDWEVPNEENNEDLNMQEEGSLVVHKKLPLYLVPTAKNNWRI